MDPGSPTLACALHLFAFLMHSLHLGLGGMYQEVLMRDIKQYN